MSGAHVPDRAPARRAAARLVRLGVAGDLEADAGAIGRLLARTDAAEIVAKAEHHRVEGLLYEWLRTVPDASPELVAALKARRDWAAQRHLYGIWQLGRVQSALEEAGLPWVIVKGPVLTEVLYGAAGRRTYHDLDVLVRPADFRAAIARLESIDGRLLDRNWRLLRREQRGQVHIALHPGMSLDLHWDLVNVHRGRMSIDTEDILARRVRVNVGGAAVPTLDPTDSLIHLAVHAAVSGGDLLVWLKDVERAIAVRPPVWDEVIERSRAWHVGGAVGLILERSRTALGAQVPEDVPLLMVGRRGMPLVRWIDRRWPFESGRRGPTPARFMARLIGHGPAGGALVLLRRVLRHFDPREPRRSSPFAPAGDQSDRDAFLSAVEARAHPGDAR